jgi:lysozyme
MIEGIDISNNQGAIDWSRVAAAGKRFAFIKSSEGTYFIDSYFDDNWQGCRDNGITPGVYHFARPDLSSAEDEADFFIELMGGPTFSPGDLVALDLEMPARPVDLGDWALTWLTRVEAGVGVKPVLYSGNWFLREHGCSGREDLANNGLWLASWQQNLPPTTPAWPVIAFWQYSAHGRVAGIHGDVDLDRFNGDEAALAAYGCPGG